MPGIRKRKPDRYVPALLVVIVINIMLKWQFFCGLVQADDFSYGVYSYTMFRDIWPWSEDMDFRMLRFGLLLPPALFFRIFPLTEFIAVLFPMIASVGTIILVFFIGRLLFGPMVGIMSAFIIATFPSDVIFGTMLLPDIVVPFYLCGTVLFFLHAERREGLKAKILYGLAGFFVFLAFITRENSYYFLLYFTPFAFTTERWKRGLYYVGIGFGLPIMLLYGVYYLKTGDFLFNVHLATKARDGQIASGYIPPNSVNRFTQFYYMFPVFFKRLGRFMSAMHGLTFYFGVPCLVYTAVKAVRKKNRMWLVIPWWFLLVYLFLEFGTLSFSHYQVMKKLPRFLLTLTPAMAIGYGVVMSDALFLGKKSVKKLTIFKYRWLFRFVTLIALAVVLYTSLAVLMAQKKSREENVGQFRWAYYDVLKDRTPKPVYVTGGWWFNKLSFYFLPDVRFADMNGRRSEMFHELKPGENPSDLSGSFVIIDRKHFNRQNDLGIQLSYDDLGFYVLLPPDEWNFLGNRNGVEIYEVPDGWTYDQSSGVATVRQVLDHSLAMGDPVRFFYCLHPDYIKTLTREDFYRQFMSLSKMETDDRNEYLNEELKVKMFDGKWKLYFGEEKE